MDITWYSGIFEFAGYGSKLNIRKLKIPDLIRCSKILKMSLIRIKLRTCDILTRFVQKYPKFCYIFVVTIFLEEIDVSSGKSVPYGFGPCSFQISCLFLDNMRHFLNMPVSTKKKRKNYNLNQFFHFSLGTLQWIV